MLSLRYSDTLTRTCRSRLANFRRGLLLNFFLEEIGPAIYNQAIADAQTRMQLRVTDLHGELFADEFQYWARLEAKRKKAANRK